MDLRQLRYFLGIVEAGSFSKAAQRLHVAQPALSQHVRNMELDLGVELLFRTPQGVTVTEAGETLLRHARAVLAQVAVAREEVIARQAEPEGEVRFGLPGTISERICVPLILEARRRFPKVKLRIAEAMSGFVLDWLREGKIDLGALYRTVSDRRLGARLVLREDLCLLGPVAPLAPEPRLSKGHVSLAAVGACRSSCRAPATACAIFWMRARRAGAELSTVTDLDTYGQIKLLVEAGVGYSILPVAAVRREVDEGRLRTWPIGTPALTRDLHLVHPADRPLGNAVRAVEQLALTILQQQVRDGTWPATLAD
uniref:Nac protein n=1 Tax=Azorhizobium caulinodans TaxID=7 RepID=O66393_AZOCA|nr:nac [Azorhizobium caulinodans] [Azorhizobium caulinodans ORS 571]